MIFFLFQGRKEKDRLGDSFSILITCHRIVTGNDLSDEIPLVFCYFLSSSSFFPQLAILVCLQRGRKVHRWDCFCLSLKLFYRQAFWSSKQLVSDVTPLPRLHVLGSESWEYFCHFDDLHVWTAWDSPIVQSLLNLQGWEQVSVSKSPFTPKSTPTLQVENLTPEPRVKQTASL